MNIQHNTGLVKNSPEPWEKTTRSGEKKKAKVVKLSKLPEAANKLCTLFNIHTEMVFAGGNFFRHN